MVDYYYQELWTKVSSIQLGWLLPPKNLLVDESIVRKPHDRYWVLLHLLVTQLHN